MEPDENFDAMLTMHVKNQKTLQVNKPNEKTETKSTQSLRRQSVREMRRMSKVELTKDYEERAIKKDIAVVKTRACTIF
jgi:hypothetical protein